MIRFQHRYTSGLVVAFLILCGGRAAGQSQTPGQITKFDPSLNVVDSVITEDASGNIGIQTTTPTAALDVALGDLNLSAGNIRKRGQLFLHDSGPFGNTFVGGGAGNQTMTSGLNTALGTFTFLNNTTGDSNTALGFEALLSNTSGGGNTATGGGALFSNTEGSNNTATGVQALGSNMTGNENTAIGREALASNISGKWNTASGFRALRSNTSGNVNTAGGYEALLNNNTGIANTAYGTAALLNNDADSNTAVGYIALRENTTGRGNTAIGIQALLGNVSGTGNTAIGWNADTSRRDLSNATAIGTDAVVDASNKIRLGNIFVTVIEGQVPYTFTSDKNQKENFQPVDSEEVLRKISDLNLTSWNYVGHDPQQFRHYGPVAQEFFAAFGHDAVGTIGAPTTINSGDLEGILMIAVQALEKQNAELRTRLEALERVVQSTTGGVR
jgi:hypothetical protein